MQVVLEGPEVALQGVPWGQFGNLLTVDRQEIESYRSIRNLVGEYAGQKQVSRPLSIAVFGTPGSGKSFGVTEMAKSLLPGQIERSPSIFPNSIHRRSYICPPPGAGYRPERQDPAGILGRVRHSLGKHRWAGCATSWRPCRMANSRRARSATRSGGPSSSSPAGPVPAWRI
jgi:hypothetical protein